MNFLLPIYIWPIYRLLTCASLKPGVSALAVVEVEDLSFLERLERRDDSKVVEGDDSKDGTKEGQKRGGKPRPDSSAENFSPSPRHFEAQELGELENELAAVERALLENGAGTSGVWKLPTKHIHALQKRRAAIVRQQWEKARCFKRKADSWVGEDDPPDLLMEYDEKKKPSHSRVTFTEEDAAEGGLIARSTVGLGRRCGK
jgi:hypothetical protein